MDIITGLSAVSETLKITKELREIDDRVAVADLKLRLSDLVDNILEAKEALQDAKQRERDLLNEINSLKFELNKKANLQNEGDFLYELDASGEKIGEPYCNLCYVREDKLYKMRFYTSSFYSENAPHYNCRNCKGNFYLKRDGN